VGRRSEWTYISHAVYLKCASDLGSKEKVVSINGDTKVSQNIGIVTGPSPAGDLVFSTAVNGKSFVYVKQGLKEGDIGFLVRESAQQ